MPQRLDIASGCQGCSIPAEEHQAATTAGIIAEDSFLIVCFVYFDFGIMRVICFVLFAQDEMQKRLANRIATAGVNPYGVIFIDEVLFSVHVYCYTAYPLTAGII